MIFKGSILRLACATCIVKLSYDLNIGMVVTPKTVGPGSSDPPEKY